LLRQGPRAVLLLLGAGCILAGVTARGEDWAGALARMPLAAGVRELNRTNCVAVMLQAFRSNAVVKALIFMPGATDELYLFRRARAELGPGQATLLDAVRALTNQTLIRATFYGPLLLLHTAEDPLEPAVAVVDPRTAARLKARGGVPPLLCNDRDWDYLQPQLRRALHVGIRPWKGSIDSWHFYRHSFAAWGLNGWEALECAALAGKSRFTVLRHQVVFEPDMRYGQ
jgi:hypothetical protein